MASPLRVLIIDKSAQAALDIVQALQHGGYALTFEQVTAPEKVQAALAKHTWDLIICDEGYTQICSGYRTLASLHRIGHDSATTLEVSTVLSHLVRQHRDLLYARESRIYLPEPGGRTLRIVVAIDGDESVVELSGVPFDVGIVRDVAQSGNGILIQAVEHDPRVEALPGISMVPGSLVCVPLTSNGQVTGVILLSRRADDPPFTPNDLNILSILAPYTAAAIENARLFRAAQQRAAELDLALEQQKELEREKDQFIQEISHELRTPIAIARGYAELLDGGQLGALGPDQQGPMAIVVRRLRMLTSLVNDINTIFEVETREPTFVPVDVTALARDATLDFQMAAQQAGIGLEAHLVDESLYVSGDVIHLRRVLDNLLNNALKFTPMGGRITVYLKQERERVIVQVVDAGVGIPEDKLPHIFERFYQVEEEISRRYGGLGLGLALVKRIIETYGGTVDVTSKLRQGSTFTVELPAIAGDRDVSRQFP
jgi:signal transduction histidine kinase